MKITVNASTHKYVRSDSDLPFDDYSDPGFEEMDAEFEKDRERDQELLDQYGGAIRIWYNELKFNGVEGDFISPGLDVEAAVKGALNQIPSKDPNDLVITQVDLLEGYYSTEGMTPYDGEPVWRSGDSRQARDIWSEAENVLKNLRLDTKEGWIREQASQYGTDLQAKETIKDIGLSEGRFKNDHEFDVLWDFAINYGDDDIDAATDITASSDLADWICDHEQACADLLTFYRVNDINALSDGQILDWISDHKQLSEDYTRRFGKDIESSSCVTSSVPAHLRDHFADRAEAKEFLSEFNSKFLADLEEAWKDYLHEMSEYYFQREDGLEVEMPNENEWLAGLAESYPASSEENIRKAWECIEILDDSAIAYS